MGITAIIVVEIAVITILYGLDPNTVSTTNTITFEVSLVHKVSILTSETGAYVARETLNVVLR